MFVGEKRINESVHFICIEKGDSRESAGKLKQWRGCPGEPRLEGSGRAGDEDADKDWLRR